MPHVPGQCIITSSSEHLYSVSFTVTQEHVFDGLFRGYDIDVISKVFTEEKSSQQIPQVLGHLEIKSEFWHFSELLTFQPFVHVTEPTEIILNASSPSIQLDVSAGGFFETCDNEGDGSLFN